MTCRWTTSPVSRQTDRHCTTSWSPPIAASVPAAGRAARPALRLVAGALRLSARVLASDPGQLPSQVTGRLTGQADPRLRNLRNVLAAGLLPGCAR